MTGYEQGRIPPALLGAVSPGPSLFDVSLLDGDGFALRRFDPPVAVDGEPAVAKVRVLEQWAYVSSQMLGDQAQLGAVIRAMAEGRPLPVIRQAVEQRKDRAALARLRYDRLMMAARRRPDPAFERLVRFHRPATHDARGVLVRPWCQVCGMELDYPCDLMHAVAEAIDHQID